MSKANEEWIPDNKLEAMTIAELIHELIVSFDTTVEGKEVADQSPKYMSLYYQLESRHL